MEHPLARAYLAKLNAAGFTDAVIVRASPIDAGQFGNSQVALRVGDLWLQVTRDRGQDILDIGVGSPPGTYYHYDDFSVAMGWTTMDAVFKRERMIPLKEAFHKIWKHRVQVFDATLSENRPKVVAAMDLAMRQRGDMNMALFSRPQEPAR